MAFEPWKTVAVCTLGTIPILYDRESVHEPKLPLSKSSLNIRLDCALAEKGGKQTKRSAHKTIMVKTDFLSLLLTERNTVFCKIWLLKNKIDQASPKALDPLGIANKDKMPTTNRDFGIQALF
jgi:hypothetical protein